MLTSHVIIVGPSCSGKSTLAAILALQFDVPLYSLDDYYIKESDPIYVMGSDGEPYRTWERPHMYDGDSMVRDARDTVQKYCIFEGFLALHYPLVQNLNARRIYLDLPFSKCLVRRRLRARGDTSDKSWEMIGEQETRDWIEPQKYFKDVVVYNANADMQMLVREITGSLYDNQADENNQAERLESNR